ncbi:hypothetical protein Mp_4g00760 [Marchantia polymorpha subsp. ruderalis]|uniref:Uncharacterized protein n=2 Tax=Marchantia polymorpha TaxID=3197 RepID=A0AAF6B4Z1_MARPO|nr:hypothetical protein MARPO_0066s0066 [Marchantia polymorpha]BBN07075.1 hypothetical protein Mp_4g00760 [Marchantia polymorpha subsp. ruderalis]|eukprot:PTQ36109.1 hypothetical protein MARPO_0066s0066 [Marchantia polymorpha]
MSRTLFASGDRLSAKWESYQVTNSLPLIRFQSIEVEKFARKRRSAERQVGIYQVSNLLTCAVFSLRLPPLYTTTCSHS